MISYTLMNDNPQNPDLMIAELKAKGMKQTEIAAIVYPELPIESAIVKVSRHLNKGMAGQYIEQTKTLALKKHGITWDRIIEPVAQALSANKPGYTDKNGTYYEGIADHGIRLRAAKQASEFMQSKISDDEAIPLSNIPEGIDEIQALRYIRHK